MSDEAQKARAAQLQELIDKRVNGPVGPPTTPHELAERAANEARREARKSTPPTITEARTRVAVPIPHEITDDSWLNRPEFAWFKQGYQYACTQNQAIPMLCQGSPEFLFHTVAAIMRGAGISVPEVKKANNE